MAIENSCAACGCDIKDNRTSAGAAMRHGGKLYCAECAAMILPPEELERLSNSVKALPTIARNRAPATSPPVPSPLPIIFVDDDVLEEAGQQEESPAEKPAKSPAASGSRVQRAALGVPSRPPTSVVGKRKKSTRSSNVPPPSSRGSSGRRSEMVMVSPRDAGARAEKESPSGRGDNSRTRKRKADSMGLYIGLGVGVLVLLVAGYFALSGNSAKSGKMKPKDAFVDNDKTPSTEYARRAEDYAAKRDSHNAVLMYGKAAERAEKEGNSKKALEYNMQSVSIEKASTLR